DFPPRRGISQRLLRPCRGDWSFRRSCPRVALRSTRGYARSPRRGEKKLDLRESGGKPAERHQRPGVSLFSAFVVKGPSWGTGAGIPSRTSPCGIPIPRYREPTELRGNGFPRRARKDSRTSGLRLT